MASITGSTDPLFILAFGAHPDDTDIGCSGTLATHARLGYSVGVCDLTKAEMSSNGTVATRMLEAQAAAQVLGLHVRFTLSLPDRGLQVNELIVSQVVDVIRRFCPVFVFAPDWEDRHPDHRQCAEIVEEAVFSAALRRYGGSNLQTHRVRQVLYYAINGMSKPDISVDVSAASEQKRAALRAYGSQFDVQQGAVATPLNQGFIEAIVGRDALVGHQTGVRYAEGFRIKRPVLLGSLAPLVDDESAQGFSHPTVT